MAQSSQDLPKLPNVDDIGDLAEQAQEITDRLSCLLLKETKWRKGLSLSQRKLLDSSINQFCGFCDATVALLETFAHLSNSFALLFNSIIERKDKSWIEDMARGLRSEIESVMKNISQIEHVYTNFTLTFGDLMRIAPDEYRQGLINDKKVFERLEAFWKVIDTQLSSVLEGRAGPPYLGASFEAKNKWQEYQGCLLGASEALMQASDSVKGTANGLGASRPSDSGLNPDYPVQGRSSLSDFVWRGFMAFWLKLKQRRAFPVEHM